MCYRDHFYFQTFSVFFLFVAKACRAGVCAEWADICIISVIRVIRDLNVDFIAPTSTIPLLGEDFFPLRMEKFIGQSRK